VRAETKQGKIVNKVVLTYISALVEFLHKNVLVFDGFMPDCFAGGCNWLHTLSVRYLWQYPSAECTCNPKSVPIMVCSLRCLGDKCCWLLCKPSVAPCRWERSEALKHCRTSHSGAAVCPKGLYWILSPRNLQDMYRDSDIIMLLLQPNVLVLITVLRCRCVVSVAYTVRTSLRTT